MVNTKPFKLYWTNERIVELIKISGTMSIPEIAKRLGVTASSIRNQARIHGITLATKRKQRFWTEEEYKYLKETAGKVCHKDMAKHLDRTIDSVRNKLRKLDIDSRKNIGCNLRRHDEHDVELCRQLYDSGMTVRIIAKKMEIPPSTINAWVEYRSRKI